jgi:peptidoglycan/LPS O-acetylase OafA/YrhL
MKRKKALRNQKRPLHFNQLEDSAGNEMQVKQRYEILDGMRGIAAVIVMLFHYNIQNGYRIFYNVFTAVDFFFILSGFVVLHSYGSKIQNGMTATEFHIRRIARLLPLTVVGVILGLPAFLMLINSSQTDFTLPGILGVAARNMLFMPAMNNNWFIADGAKITGQLFPTDGPLWSIFFEFVIGFGFIYLLRWKNVALANFCALSFGALILYSIWNGHYVGNRTFDFDAGWGNNNFIGGFARVMFGFTCGMLIYRIANSLAFPKLGERLKHLKIWNAAVVYTALILMLTFPFYIKGVYSLFEIGFLAPLLVFQGSRTACTTVFMKKVSHYLGVLSFPVYCLHYPIMAALKVLATATNFSSPDSTAIMICAILLTLVISFGITILFERLGVQKKIIAALDSVFVKNAVVVS